MVENYPLHKDIVAAWEATEATGQDRGAGWNCPRKMPHPHVRIPPAAVRTFCERHDIRKLALFGSVLGESFRPESDVDVLVEFRQGAVVGLLGLARIERELSDLVGRKVDLRTAADLSRYFRDDVVRSAEVLYVEE